MVPVPVVCLVCGYLFQPDVLGQEAGRLATAGLDALAFGDKSCPRCHGGRDLSGERLPVAATVETLLHQGTSPEDLGRLATVISDSIKDGATRRETAALIDARVPSFNGLSVLLPRTWEELYPFLAFVAAFLQLVVSLYALRGDQIYSISHSDGLSSSATVWQYY